MIEKIKNYRLKQFKKLDNATQVEYIRVLDLLNPLETTNELIHMSFRNVEFIKTAITSQDEEDLFEIFIRVQGITRKQLMNMKIVTFFGLYNGIKEQLTQLLAAEDNAFTSQNGDIRWEAVDGSGKMAKFGVYNVLDGISNGDILKWELIMELEYSEVFLKLLMNQTKSDLQKEMNNLKLNKVD